MTDTLTTLNDIHHQTQNCYKWFVIICEIIWHCPSAPSASYPWRTIHIFSICSWGYSHQTEWYSKFIVGDIKQGCKPSRLDGDGLFMARTGTSVWWAYLSGTPISLNANKQSWEFILIIRCYFSLKMGVWFQKVNGISEDVLYIYCPFFFF